MMNWGRTSPTLFRFACDGNQDVECAHTRYEVLRLNSHENRAQRTQTVVENARFYAPKRTIAFFERFRGTNRWSLSVLGALERRTIASGRVLDHCRYEIPTELTDSPVHHGVELVNAASGNCDVITDGAVKYQTNKQTL